MRKELVIAHFGTASAVAEKLEISRQAVSSWGNIIPEGMAYKIQVITAGVLSVDPNAYRKIKQHEG